MMSNDNYIPENIIFSNQNSNKHDFHVHESSNIGSLLDEKTAKTISLKDDTEPQSSHIELAMRDSLVESEHRKVDEVNIKPIMRPHFPADGESPVDPLISISSGETEDLKIDEVNTKPILNRFPAEEGAPIVSIMTISSVGTEDLCLAACQTIFNPLFSPHDDIEPMEFHDISENLEILESLAHNKQEQKQDLSKFYRRNQNIRPIYRWGNLSTIEEEEEEEEPCTDAAEKTLIDDHHNPLLCKVRKEIDAKFIMEVTYTYNPQEIQPTAINKESKGVATEIQYQQKSCEAQRNQTSFKVESEGTDFVKTNKSPETKIIKNVHPLFISADGQKHELLLQHKRVMELTKPSPYVRFHKCMDLRRYFGGLPNDYECNKHKEENRVPLWIQKYLYDYRRFMRNLQDDREEEYCLKRLVKPGNERKLKDNSKMRLRFAKICRLCGEKSYRFVTTGHNVVIKLVSVYLPLVILEDNQFPLGLCDKCDYSLSLICSFMLHYLDCEKLQMNEKKCFTCRCSMENLLTLADETTMIKLATAFCGIILDLHQFLGKGGKYLCNACRLTFELLENFREYVWLTNKLFEDGDERLYETEEVYKEQVACEIVPVEVFKQPTMLANSQSTLQSTLGNCSLETIIDTESYYTNDLEPRKYFLKLRQRHGITKYLRRVFRCNHAETKPLQKSPKKSKEGNIISDLKSSFTSLFTRNINTGDLKNQRWYNYESVAASNESEENDPTQSYNLKPIVVEPIENSQENPLDDENHQSVLPFDLDKLDTSLFAYFNADIVLPPDTTDMKMNTKEPQPSTSKSVKMQVAADVHSSNNSTVSEREN